jgi:hypothetical protein
MENGQLWRIKHNNLVTVGFKPANLKFFVIPTSKFTDVRVLNSITTLNKSGIESSIGERSEKDRGRSEKDE